MLLANIPNNGLKNVHVLHRYIVCECEIARFLHSFQMDKRLLQELVVLPLLLHGRCTIFIQYYSPFISFFYLFTLSSFNAAVDF